jgi:hypothetical protein
VVHAPGFTGISRKWWFLFTLANGARSYDPSVAAPGQRIGHRGPSCLGLLGMLLATFVVVLVFAWLMTFRVGVWNEGSAGNSSGVVCTGHPPQTCTSITIPNIGSQRDIGAPDP